MNIMKKKMKRFRLFFNKYINGTKGVISLFLVLVMLPFSSTALLLVESARYQNAIELVDEMLDCIGLSTIADFDGYLEERFGLLAMSQENAPMPIYNKYLTANLPALNNNFSCTSSLVEGVYPLSNESVLKEQLLEYSEVSVAIEALYNGLDVDKLLEDLYKQMGLEELNKTTDAVTKVADVAASTADLVSAVKDGISEYGTYATQLSEYKTAASDFRTKASTLITALTNAKANLTEDDEPNDIYNDSTVKKAVKELEGARDTFKKEAGEMSASVGTMKSAVEKIFSAANKITEKANSAQNAINKSVGTTIQEDCTTTTSEWILKVASEVTNVFYKTIKSTYSADMQNQVQLLNAQAAKLGKVVCNKTSGGDTTSGNYHIDVSSTSTKINEDFCDITIDSVCGNFGSEMQGIINVFEEQPSISDEVGSSLGKLLDVAAELLNVTAFYNGELDAHVSSTVFYDYNPGDMSFSSTTIMLSLTTIVQSGQDFVDSLTKVDILKALKAAAEFLLGIGEFLASIVLWVGEVCVNVVKLIASGTEIYDTFLLTAYGVYNMPCRTTYSSGSSLSGYSYNKIFNMQGGTAGNKFTGSMSDLQTLMSSTATGSDPGFRGAETEYLLIGGENELLNQSAAFFNLYMLRMILDLQPIFTNKQVKAMAASATVAGWVVYLALIIAEPMIDALLLVNNQSTYLIKDQVYLTPGGMILLLETLPKLLGVSGETKDTIGAALVAKNGEAKASGHFEMNYQEHMMLLLLLTTSQQKILSRMTNLIQMEAAQYYKEEYMFNLDNANTYLKATVNGTLNSMFDMEALTSGGPFTMSRTRYIGY